jgi:hypothetical protein
VSTDAGERAAFEAWCRKRWAGDRGALTLRPDGSYINGHVEFAWSAWQEARANQEAFLRNMLWGTHPECCGRPSFAGEGVGEEVCCGRSLMSPLSDERIVASLREQFPKPDPSTAPKP